MKRDIATRNRQALIAMGGLLCCITLLFLLSGSISQSSHVFYRLIICGWKTVPCKELKTEPNDKMVLIVERSTGHVRGTQQLSKITTYQYAVGQAVISQRYETDRPSHVMMYNPKNPEQSFPGDDLAGLLQILAIQFAPGCVGLALILAAVRHFPSLKNSTRL